MIKDPAACCGPELNARLLEPTTIKLIAAAVVVNADKKILIAQRPIGKNMAGLWEFPGGKIEKNESPEATLVRELKEEVGIKTCAGCLSPLTFASYHYPDFHLLMPLYVCYRFEGEAIGKEGQQVRWVKGNELKDYPMPEANRRVIGTIRDLYPS